LVSNVADDAPSAPASTAGGLLGKLPRELWWALPELLALTGLAIAQPLLDVTGKAPDFFLYHRAGRNQILAVITLIVLAPPVGLWLGEVIAALVGGERLRRLAHLGALAGLVTVLAIELGKKVLPIRGTPLALAALLVGLAVVWAYAKGPVLRMWLRYLSPAPLLFALLFVAVSPSSSLVLPARAGMGTVVPVRTDVSKPLPPVVMIVFDEFPLMSLLDSQGEVDPRVYPNFAEFAAHSIWYRNATGIGGWTPYAVPAMLSGRYPGKDRKSVAPNISSYPDNLFTMFGHYYNLKVFETVTELCPADKCGQTGSPTAFTDLALEAAKVYKSIVWPIETATDPASTVGEEDGPTAYFGNLKYDQPHRVDTFVRSISSSDRQPTLYFLHLLLPHTPWRYLPDGRVYNAESLPIPVRPHGVWPDAIQSVHHQQHLLQVAYTDKLLGTVIDRLKRQGLWDASLVILTADHGEGFTPGNPARALGSRNAAELMWVPMFLKAPGQSRGRVDDRNWEHVDLLPTVAAMAGLTVPWQVDGFAQNGPSIRLRTDKVFYNRPGQQLVRPGPPNFQKVLHGVTDTLVRAHQYGERGFYQFGMTADWIYEPAARIGHVVAGDSVTAKLNDWRLFDRVDPKDRAVPSLVAGEVTSGTPPPGARMVIVVNGQVGATAGFYPLKASGPARSFAGLVPAFLYKTGPGQPQLQLSLATRSGGNWLLRPVSLSGSG
jgi:Sulfatase